MKYDARAKRLLTACLSRANSESFLCICYYDYVDDTPIPRGLHGHRLPISIDGIALMRRAAYEAYIPSLLLVIFKLSIHTIEDNAYVNVMIFGNIVDDIIMAPSIVPRCQIQVAIDVVK